MNQKSTSAAESWQTEEREDDATVPQESDEDHDKFMERVLKRVGLPTSVTKAGKVVAKVRQDNKRNQESTMCRACGGEGLRSCEKCVTLTGVVSMKCDVCLGLGRVFCKECGGSGRDPAASKNAAEKAPIENPPRKNDTRSSS